VAIVQRKSDPTVERASNKDTEKGTPTPGVSALGWSSRRIARQRFEAEEIRKVDFFVAGKRGDRRSFFRGFDGREDKSVRGEVSIRERYFLFQRGTSRSHFERGESKAKEKTPRCGSVVGES